MAAPAHDSRNFAVWTHFIKPYLLGHIARYGFMYGALSDEIECGAVQRMEGIKDLNFRRFRTQGTVGVGVSITTSTAWSPAGDCRPTISAGSTPAIPCSCCPSPCCAACSATGSSMDSATSTARNGSTAEVRPPISAILSLREPGAICRARGSAAQLARRGSDFSVGQLGWGVLPGNS
jgi:hypothetical protein